MAESASEIVPMNAAHTSDPGAQTVRKLFWRLIPFLFFVYVVNYLDRINVGFAALQMQAQLGLSDRVYGLGAGIFFIGYLGCQLPSNLLLTRIGARRWIAAIIMVWGVISSCMIFIRTAHEFYAMRFLLGVAESGFFPGIILYLKNWIPAQARARGIALFMAGIPIAGLVGGPISGALLELRAGPLAGWQWLFLLEGAPAVLLSLITLRILTDTPQSTHWLTDDERAWLTAELQREHLSHPDVSQSWRSAFANPNVWLLTIVYFGMTTCTYGIIYFLPKMVRSVSAASNFVIGLLSAVPYVVAAIAMVLAGTSSDRRGEQRQHLAVLAVIGSVGACAAGFAGSTGAVIALLCVAAAGSFSMLGLFWALAASSVSEATAAAGIAIINSLGNLGGFFGPYTVGLLRSVSSGFRGGMIAVGIAVLLAGSVAQLVRPRHIDVVPN
jgi:MFS transporter, ACS family, tartrate transporter